MAVDMSGLLAYFGHHKCGTQWMKRIVGDVGAIVGREVVIQRGPATVGPNLEGSIRDPARSFLCYLNADGRHLKGVTGIRGFHMVRDPRDIVVSAYYSHLHSHSDFGDLAAYRERLRSVDQAEGLMLELENRVHQFGLMRRWDYKRDDILELRMEDTTTDARRVVPRILEFLGLGEADGLDAGAIDAVVERNEFSALAGRPPGTEDVASHFRKGVAGDWVEHFGDEHVAYFKANYNDLLLELGYETSPDWAAPGRAGAAT